MLQLVVVGILQFFTGQFTFTDSQQEFSLLFQAGGGILTFLGGQVVALQHVGSCLKQTDSFAPELYIGLHITCHHRLWGTASATLCSKGLLGVKDGIMFQLCPRCQRRIQVLLLPLRCEHEVGITFTSIVHRLQSIYPSGTDRLLPVDLLHALLHLAQSRHKTIPLLRLFQLFQQDALSRLHPHRGHHVKSLRQGSLGGAVVVIHHFKQHLTVRHIALGQEIDLIRTGIFEFRMDTCLLLGQRLNLTTQLGHRFLILHQFTGLAPLHQLMHLHDGNIVWCAKEPCHRLKQLLVQFTHLGISRCELSQHEGCLQLRGVICSEWHRLKPHHRLEVGLQRIIACIMSTRTEQRIRERYFDIAEIFRPFAFCRIHFLYLIGHSTCSTLFAFDQSITHIEVGLQPLQFWCRTIGQLPSSLTQLQHHVVKFLLFDVAQQTVEIEMIQLQVEISGHEVGEVCIVIGLIHLEQLVVLGGYDGKAVSTQLILQSGIEICHLHGIHHIIHINTMTVHTRFKVLLLQFLLTCLQLVDERVFRLTDLEGHLAISFIVIITLIARHQIFHLSPASPHQRVIP